MPQILEILTAPNPALHKKAQTVQSVTPEIKRLIDDMTATMRQKDGMGLAAVQVGQDLKIAVVENKSTDKSDKPSPLPLTVLINPKIIYYGTLFDEEEEGCLSVPGKQYKIVRPTEIKVIYFDIEGRRRRLNAKGLPARIIQHELDHLDGVLVTDRFAMQEKEKNAS